MVDALDGLAKRYPVRVPVLLTEFQAPWNAGEVGHFTKEHAERIVDAGHGRYYDPENEKKIAAAEEEASKEEAAKRQQDAIDTAAKLQSERDADPGGVTQSPDIEGSTDRYDGMTNDELYDLCREAGIPVSGTKGQMQARLRAHDAEQGTE